MTLETNKNKMKPVEKIPVEWYRALVDFLDRDDPSSLTTEMLGGVIQEGQLDLFKTLFVRDRELSRMDVLQRDRSPLKLNVAQEGLLDEINDKVQKSARNVIKKINPSWPTMK